MRRVHTGARRAIAKIPLVAEDAVIISRATGVKGHRPLARRGIGFIEDRRGHNLGHRGIVRLHLHRGLSGVGLTGSVDGRHGQRVGAHCPVAMPHRQPTQVGSNTAKATRAAQGLHEHRLGGGEAIHPDVAGQITGCDS